MSVRFGARAGDRRSAARRSPASSPVLASAVDTPASHPMAEKASAEPCSVQPLSVKPASAEVTSAQRATIAKPRTAEPPSAQPQACVAGPALQPAATADALSIRELPPLEGATPAQPPGDDNPFSDLVRERFGRHASRYSEQARLQRGVAWRLAHLCRELPLPPGPCADLGAGTGLLSQALRQLRPSLNLRQIDLCPELLACNPLAQQGDDAALVWDLNRGLPPGLTPAALLVSSFALQWLEDPALELGRWCAQLLPGGWLALALPTAGSLHGWHQAAEAASVPCSALPLPSARRLITVATAGLELRHRQTLHFTSSARNGRQALGRIGALGAGASRAARLTPGQLRRLLAHWPRQPAWRWEVLLLLGRRR